MKLYFAATMNQDPTLEQFLQERQEEFRHTGILDSYYQLRSDARRCKRIEADLKGEQDDEDRSEGVD